MTNLPYLIWSDYHEAWLRPGTAMGYTDHVSSAGIFTDRKVDTKRERKVYRDDAYPKILRRRAELIKELTLLTSVEEGLFGGSDAIRLAMATGRHVDELELSIRSANCLRAAGIETVGDLAAKSRSDLLTLQHFGRKSLREIVEALDSLGLELRREP
jgi:hypothetical protein